MKLIIGIILMFSLVLNFQNVFAASKVETRTNELGYFEKVTVSDIMKIVKNMDLFSSRIILRIK